jgi:pimeloyl-ACP methyl ester carboxylesterase
VSVIWTVRTKTGRFLAPPHSGGQKEFFNAPEGQLLGTENAPGRQPMNVRKEPVCLGSQGDTLAGTLFLPEAGRRVPVLVICHGAGEFKENYFELCELLAQRGVATLALDMHGHGQSSGQRFAVNIRLWVADVRSAIDFLFDHPAIDGNRIGAFGLSSGGTAILEAAMIDPRLKALVALDATVRNSLPIRVTLLLKLLTAVGKLTKWLTKHDLRVPLAKISNGFHLAADPVVQARLQSDPQMAAAFMSFPFPGGAEAFFVDTLKRVSRITAATLVLWGEEDRLDPPETARLLFQALECKKQLHIIPGNGHVGHLDRNRSLVFALTADWALDNLT